MIVCKEGFPADGMKYSAFVEAFTGIPFDRLLKSFISRLPCRLTPSQAHHVLNEVLYGGVKHSNDCIIF